MATLSPLEIDIGRKVDSCSCIFQTHLIFLFSSTITPSPPTAQFVFCFVFTGGFGFLASLTSCVLALLKHFGSLATDRDSFLCVYRFRVVCVLKIAITVIPSLRGYGSKSLPGDVWNTLKL